MPKGRYGTSISIHTAMDPGCDVLLAYQQNGEDLIPDHGYPLRLVIPGYIGGRMIKWLNEIEVSSEESDNYFHYNDNRVLPEHVTAELANSEGWWYKPDFIINELSIQSAIAYPGHHEVVALGNAQATYPIRGYAYSGGGRKVIRVEVSIDGGKTWTLSNLNHPETPTPHGKYWCWCFWQLDVPLAKFYECENPEILCRAWDSSMNRQPEKITWNVMGMMNNSYFRIKVHRVMEDGMPALKFQHPTQAGPGNFGGWFEEQSLGKGDAAAAPVQAPSTSNGKKFSAEEVSKHDKKEDCWIIVKDKVYDATKYVEEHPGGEASLLLAAGQDCTEDFEALHSSKAWKALERFYIGDLADEVAKESVPLPVGGSSQLVTLQKGKSVTLALEKKDLLSHDTRKFRFALPTKDHILGLPTGQHIFVKAKHPATGEIVMRAYTPSGSGPGYVDIIIKVYFANVNPRFPDGGKLTQILDNLAIGETIDVKGPLGEFIFNTDVPVCTNVMPTFTFTPTGEQFSFDTIGFIAGGSGITPVLQVTHALLADSTRAVKISILFANRTVDDILCKDLLDALEEDERVSIWYTLSVEPSTPWNYSVGHINEEMIEKSLPPPGEHTYVFMCGPQPMIDCACTPNLFKLGHKEDHMHCF